MTKIFERMLEGEDGKSECLPSEYYEYLARLGGFPKKQEQSSRKKQLVKENSPSPITMGKRVDSHIDEELLAYERKLYHSVYQQDVPQTDASLANNPSARMQLLENNAQLDPFILANAMSFITSLLARLFLMNDQIRQDENFIGNWGKGTATRLGKRVPPVDAKKKVQELTNQIIDETCIHLQLFIEYLNNWKYHNNPNIKTSFKDTNLDYENYFKILSLLHGSYALLEKNSAGNSINSGLAGTLQLYEQAVFSEPMFSRISFQNHSSWRFSKNTMAKADYVQARLEHDLNGLAPSDNLLQTKYSLLKDAHTETQNLKRKLIPFFHYFSRGKISKQLKSLETQKKKLADRNLVRFLTELQEGTADTEVLPAWADSLPNNVANALSRFIDVIQEPSKLVSATEFEWDSAMILRYAYKGNENINFDLINRNIIEQSLSKKVNTTKTKAFRLIFAYSKEKAYEILRPNEDAILQYLNSDPWNQENAFKELAAFLNIDVDDKFLEQAFVILTTEFLKRYWFESAKLGKVLHRLSMILDLKSLDPSLAMLLKWKDNSLHEAEPLAQLLSFIEQTPGGIEESEAWLASTRVIYGLVSSLTNVMQFGFPQDRSNEILEQMTTVLANRYSRSPYPMVNNFLNEVFRTLSNRQGVNDAHRQLFNKIVREQWSIDLSAVRAQVEEIQERANETLAEGEAVINETRALHVQVRAQLAEMDAVLADHQRRQAPGLLDNLSRSIAATRDNLAQHNPQRNGVRTLIDFRIDRENLMRLFSEASDNRTNRHVNMLIRQINQLSQLGIHHRLQRELRIVLDVLSAANSGEQHPQALITRLLAHSNAAGIGAFRYGRGGLPAGCSSASMRYDFQRNAK